MTYFVFNPEVESERETARQIIKFYEQNQKENPKQQKIDSEQDSKEDVCAKCGKEVDQKVINYCTHPDQKSRFKNKILCRECQEGY